VSVPDRDRNRVTQRDEYLRSGLVSWQALAIGDNGWSALPPISRKVDLAVVALDDCSHDPVPIERVLRAMARSHGAKELAAAGAPLGVEGGSPKVALGTASSREVG
jgi:hypothetical protein